ncbi:hypothetical protein ABBQ32_004365 [Trebouxia sp. C0010 RCD-2024]
MPPSPSLVPANKKPRRSSASVFDTDTQHDSMCETPGFGGDLMASHPPVGGVHTRTRLDSMEKFFGSQGLASPPEMQHAGHKRTASEREVTDEDFVIHCSQSYTRTASQSIPDSSLEAPETSNAASASNAVGSSAGQAEEVERRNAPGGTNTTPELANDATGASTSSSQEKKLFPIFRPKGERKTLYIIRHGESEFNAATNTGKGFSDPQIYDPKLTAKGQSQASRLRSKLAEQKIPEEALWVTSPLTRAIDTLILACPQPQRLGSPVPPLAEAGPSASNQAQLPPFKVVVRSELSEHMVTTGDVGLPASALRSRYPQLCGAMGGLSEHWWWSPADNNAELHRFHKSEPKQKMKDRVAAFNRWVQSRPEKVIVAFGHSSFWCEFLGGRTRLRNCELHTHFV